MTDLPYRTTLFAIHQLTVVLGILLMPLALAARHLGVRVPLHRAIEATGRAYRNARPAESRGAGR